MSDTRSPPIETKVIIERRDFDELFSALQARGYTTIGPTVRDQSIVYEEVRCAADLPVGWTDEQDGGHYRLRKRGDAALFGYGVGVSTWKQYLHPPVVRLWQAMRANGHFELEPETIDPPRYALLGVRACDLRAMQIQDRVLMADRYTDPIYQGRREQALTIAINCTLAGGACFCVSMGTGPEAHDGFDMALTEVLQPERHFFVAEAGSERGAEVLADVTHRHATRDEIETAECAVAAVAKKMGHTVETEGLKELLYRNLENPHWDDVAERCLTCGACTMVCPTCFCTTVEDVTDVTGTRAERWRKADSCFLTEFSHIYGGNLRATARSRYRQWLTHKFAYWVDQFDSFGCVGCGRCITWCPVGIDITAEVRALQRSDAARQPAEAEREAQAEVQTEVEDEEELVAEA